MIGLYGECEITQLKLSSNVFKLLPDAHVNQLGARIAVPHSETRHQTRVKEGLNPHVFGPSQLLNLLRNLRQVLGLQLHHRGHHRQLRFGQLVIHQVELLRYLINEIDPLRVHQDVQEVSGVGLEPRGLRDLVHHLPLLLHFQRGVREEVRHPWVREQLVDFLDVGGGRVQSVVGARHVSQSRRVAGGRRGGHSCARGAVGAAGGGGELELEGGEGGAGQGDGVSGFLGEGLSGD